MKFKNPSLISVWMDGLTDGQAQKNMPLQLFQSCGHKKNKNIVLCTGLLYVSVYLCLVVTC